MSNFKGAAAPIRVERRNLSDLKPYERNARVHPPEQLAQIKASLLEFGWTYPMLIDGRDELIAGHGRWTVAQQIRDEGLTIPNWPDASEGPVIVAEHLTAEQRRAYVIADNRIAEGARWDDAVLKLELADLQQLGVQASTLGFEAADLKELMTGQPAPGRHANGDLAERFGIPPFTVLNAREGWWQDRKRAWLALGIRSELGRGEGAAPGGGGGAWGHRGPNEAYRNASPGGSPRPAMKLKAGRTVRGDGRGRPLNG